MIQACFVFFQLFGLLLLQMLSSGGFSATPVYLPPTSSGQLPMVQVRIHPSGVSGFVKFEQEIPYGYRAKELDTKGGKFLFAEQMVKISWTKFPSDSDFTISYSLELAPGAPERARFKGNFSYLEDNSKVIYPLPVTQAYFGKNSAAETTATSHATDQASKQVSTSENTSENVSQKKVTGLTCTREITNLTERSVLIKVVINNPDGLQGFAKLEDIVPPGFMAKVYESNGVSFSFVNSRARMLWAQLPAAKEFYCSYKIMRIESDATSLDLEGNLSYVRNGESISVNINTPGIEFKAGEPGIAEKYKTPPSVASSPAKDKNTPTTSLASTATKEKKPSEDNKEKSKAENQTSLSQVRKNEITMQKSQASETKQTEDKISTAVSESTPEDKTEKLHRKTAEVKEGQSISMPASSGENISTPGVTFRVQVCAVKTMASTESVAGELSLSEAITPEMHDGWHKYTIGGFETYRDAKELRNKKSTLPTGPFVTAYNKGTRITVQEALMITRQTWIK